MPAEFQKAMDRAINNEKKTFCFFDDILIVSKGTKSEHKKVKADVLEKLEQENISFKLSTCEFFMIEVNWQKEGSHLKL